jgi:hypothetical protein
VRSSRVITPEEINSADDDDENRALFDVHESDCEPQRSRQSIRAQPRQIEDEPIRRPRASLPSRVRAVVDEDDPDPPCRPYQDRPPKSRHWDDGQEPVQPKRPRQSRQSARSRPVEDEDDVLDEFSSVASHPTPHRHHHPKLDTSRQSARQPGCDSLRTVNADLQSQIRELESSNKELIGEISVLRNDKVRAAEATAAVGESERKHKELTQLLRSKEASFDNLDQEYERLQQNYARLTELSARGSEVVAAKQAEITRLTQELDQWKQVRVPTEPEPWNQSRAVPESEPPPPATRRQTPATPPAMKDNLVFGDDQPAFRPARGPSPDSLSNGELQLRYKELVLDKEMKEKQLNRAPPKGAKFARVRLEKEQLEQEVMELAAQISKLKFEMNKRGIF